MLDGVGCLLAAQGFSKRMSQYRRVSQLPANSFNDRYVVKHLRTGKKFELKSVDLADEVRKSHLLAQLGVLQNTKKSKFCAEVVDFFEEDGQLHLVTKYLPQSLRAYIVEHDRVRESLACRFLQQIARGV